MAGPRKLPDATTLRLLWANGWRLVDIAGKFGVTEAGVRRALERAGVALGRATYRDILPWVISPEHKSTEIMWRFRSILKQREGRELGEDEQETLARRAGRGPSGGELPPGGPAQRRLAAGRLVLRSPGTGR